MLRRAEHHGAQRLRNLLALHLAGGADLARRELDVAQRDARAHAIGDGQLDLLTMPRVEVGDPVTRELA